MESYTPFCGLARSARIAFETTAVERWLHYARYLACMTASEKDFLNSAQGVEQQGQGSKPGRISCRPGFGFRFGVHRTLGHSKMGFKRGWCGMTPDPHGERYR